MTINKNLPIFGMVMMTIVFLFVIISMVISTVYIEKYHVEFAKAGLEECPQDPNALSNKTIWVKDCIKYRKETN